jgi:hypothetical protein
MNHHSGLEVAVHQAPEVPAYDGLEPDWRYQQKQTNSLYGPPGHAPAADAPAQDGKDARILGLRRKHFWIVVAVALVVVIGAAVGGGVGGAMANKSDDGYVCRCL